jgi:hypothetical protein
LGRILKDRFLHMSMILTLPQGTFLVVSFPYCCLMRQDFFLISRSVYFNVFLLIQGINLSTRVKTHGAEEVPSPHEVIPISVLLSLSTNGAPLFPKQRWEEENDVKPQILF